MFYLLYLSDNKNKKIKKKMERKNKHQKNR